MAVFSMSFPKAAAEPLKKKKQMTGPAADSEYDDDEEIAEETSPYFPIHERVEVTDEVAVTISNGPGRPGLWSARPGRAYTGLPWARPIGRRLLKSGLGRPRPAYRLGQGWKKKKKSYNNYNYSVKLARQIWKI
jgi:hypothetical protein